MLWYLMGVTEEAEKPVSLDEIKVMLKMEEKN